MSISARMKWNSFHFGQNEIVISFQPKWNAIFLIVLRNMLPGLWLSKGKIYIRVKCCISKCDSCLLILIIWVMLVWQEENNFNSKSLPKLKFDNMVLFLVQNFNWNQRLQYIFSNNLIEHGKIIWSPEWHVILWFNYCKSFNFHHLSEKYQCMSN